MATSYWFMFFLLSVLSLFASSTCNSIPYVGSNELKFWKENVVNEMPQALVSKLSPMNMIDSKYYTSLVSKKAFSFDAQSCLLADIFCTSETNAQTSKLPNQAKVYPSKIPNQAKVYASKLPNQAKVYPSKIPNQAKVYTTKIPNQAKVYASKLPNQAKVYPSKIPNQTKVYTSKIFATSHSNSHHLGEVSFFRVSTLKPGNTVHLDNLVNPFPHRSFLPSQIASKISINSNHLQHLFPQTFTSPFTKDTTKTTILNCNAPTLKGEVKTCAKSLEEMIEFSKTTLKQNHLISLTTDSIQGSGQKLKIEKFHKINSQKSVSCHEIFLPFATYFCHLLSSTNIYAVELVDLNTNAHVNTAMVVCHMDTSSWPADHPVFKKLNFSPGKGEVCHWMSQADLVWVGDDAHA
ncbi:BURP domain-containing protein 16-like isoform X1 [Solanum tuberosum]|uniref:BURP domain-containing protein 16-like isoform X1 n=1 Tax=Solanum tuberosum TaxID=4113 RepID=UPI00073A2CD4|nr:PREDICTED: BURP domain-containing protein 16-like isoform X1 [Solanum tuberosum]